MEYLIKTEYNKLRYKWRELSKELLELKPIEQMAMAKFHETLMSRVREFGLKDPFLENQKKDTEDKKIFEEEETKKIYRQVAVRSHPDKNKNDDDIFKDLVDSKKNNSLNKLLDNAKKVRLKIDNISIEQIEKIEEEINELEKSISEIINSTHWRWYHEDNRSRDLIINNLIIIITNEQKEKQIK